MKVGISLKEKFFEEVLETKPEIAFFEIHAENYFECVGQNFELLCEVAKLYPISMHCVGLSLGSAETLDKEHLTKIANLANKINPILISEHLSFAKFGKHNFHDLMPVPYTKESLDLFETKIIEMQNILGHQILIENPSKYLEYNCNEYSEPEFLNLLTEKTNCGLIVDTNNIFVTSNNLELVETEYLKNINKDSVKEIHLAGPELDEKRNLLLDTHSTPVRDNVLKITKDFLNNITPHILYEWDNNVPKLQDFIMEKNRVEAYLND